MGAQSRENQMLNQLLICLRRRDGRILTLPPRSCNDPEFIPVVIMSGLSEGAEMAHAFGSPELSRTFESALALAASRFNGTRTDGPTTTVKGLVVHPVGMSC